MIGLATGGIATCVLVSGDGGRDGGSGTLAGSGALSSKPVPSTASCFILCPEGGADVARLVLCRGGTGDERVEGVTDDSEIVETVEVPSLSGPSTGGDWVSGVRRSREPDRVWLCDRKGRTLTSNGLSESESSNVAGRRGT